MNRKRKFLYGLLACVCAWGVLSIAPPVGDNPVTNPKWSIGGS
jgi:hypothetical protein